MGSGHQFSAQKLTPGKTGPRSLSFISWSAPFWTWSNSPSWLQRTALTHPSLLDYYYPLLTRVPASYGSLLICTCLLCDFSLPLSLSRSSSRPFPHLKSHPCSPLAYFVPSPLSRSSRLALPTSHPQSSLSHQILAQLFPSSCFLIPKLFRL